MKRWKLVLGPGRYHCSGCWFSAKGRECPFADNGDYACGIFSGDYPGTIWVLQPVEPRQSWVSDFKIGGTCPD